MGPDPMTLRSLVALALFIGPATLAIACGSDGPEGSGSDDSSSSSGTAGTGGTATGGGEGGENTGGDGGSGGTVVPTGSQQTISGDVTWSVTFDAAAQMAGAADCSYTRHYEGVEDWSRPWLCPSCEVIFRADVTMTSGEQDCYSQVSANPPAEEEWIGWANGTWMRGAGLQLSEQGTVTIDGVLVTNANQVTMLDAPVGGMMGFDVAGALTLGAQEGDVGAGYSAAADSYACGWPKADPPAYTGDYTLAVGQTMPDGLFTDACGEVVRLHDFAGSYLVVDMSAIDCPPCQQMASLEEQFVADMAGLSIDVHVVTMLAPSLDDVLGDTTVSDAQQLDQHLQPAVARARRSRLGLSHVLAGDRRHGRLSVLGGRRSQPQRGAVRHRLRGLGVDPDHHHQSRKHVSRVELAYFDCRGRAQPIRGALTNAKDVVFTDTRVAMEAWPDLKGSTPFAGLPTMTWDDVALAETLPIASFAAKRLGNYDGLDDARIGYLESVCSLAYTEVILRIGEVLWTDAIYPSVTPKQALAVHLDRVIGKLAGLDRTVASASFLGGDTPAMADYFAFEAVHTIRYVTDGAKLGDACPSLCKLADRVEPYARRAQRPARLTARPDEAAVVEVLLA